jgi:hypothetical protein
MSDIQVVVRDARRDYWGVVHAASAGRLVASLSAEPESFEELRTAFGRFEKAAERIFQLNFMEGLEDRRHDAGLVIIDLAARLIAYQSSYDDLLSSSSVTYHDGCAATSRKIRYRLPDDWLVTTQLNDWRAIAEKRREARLARIKMNPRQVLYGSELYQFLVDHCFHSKVLADNISQMDRAATESWCRRIHAQWLLEPRASLNDTTPRSHLIHQSEFIDADLWSREEQWSLLGDCPAGLPMDSFAYQHAPFGTHEFVIYHHLVERLLECCVERIDELLRLQRVADPRVEQDRLMQLGELWLHTAIDDYRGMTPAAIIELERRRIPIAISPEENILDCDCPICHLMADLPGPSFWHFDTSNLPSEFVFSRFESLEEWEEVSDSLDDPDPAPGYIDASVISKQDFNSFASCSAPNMSFVTLFSLGCSLSDLIVQLKTERGGKTWIDELNRHFANLREVILNSDEYPGLIEPVLEVFHDSLESVRDNYPRLNTECDEVRLMLDSLLELADSTPTTGEA